VLVRGGFSAALRAATPLSLALSALGALAGLLMVLAELSTIAAVDVASGNCEVINDSNPELADRCRLSGLERHNGGLLLLGLLAIAMAWGAGIGRSRPAAIALAVAGAVVLAITIALDLPETRETGAIGLNFAGASGQPGTGFYLALVAGGLALAAGAAGLLRKPR
jgi:hypothetical protein